MWKKGQSGNSDGRRIRADDDWLAGESKEDRRRRRSRERAAKWRADNPERVAELRAASQAQRKLVWDDFLAGERSRYRRASQPKLEKQKAERAKDPEKFRSRLRQHYQGNKHKYVASVAARRASRLQATPRWVDKKEIILIYAEARRLTKLTGIPHEVDHIHPLKGRSCCGLHVPWNLQIITRSQNRSKHNRLILDTALENNSRPTMSASNDGLAL